MKNGRSLIKLYHKASILDNTEVGNAMTDIFRRVNIKYGSIDYNSLRTIVDELEKKRLHKNQ